MGGTFCQIGVFHPAIIRNLRVQHVSLTLKTVNVVQSFISDSNYDLDASNPDPHSGLNEVRAKILKPSLLGFTLTFSCF